MTTNDRINAILANPEFTMLHREGTLEKTKRSYAFWFLTGIDSPAGSVQRKLAKRYVRKMTEKLFNEHLAFITRIGINNRPNG